MKPPNQSQPQRFRREIFATKQRSQYIDAYLHDNRFILHWHPRFFVDDFHAHVHLLITIAVLFHRVKQFTHLMKPQARLST